METSLSVPWATLEPSHKMVVSTCTHPWQPMAMGDNCLQGKFKNPLGAPQSCRVIYIQAPPCLRGTCSPDGHNKGHTIAAGPGPGTGLYLLCRQGSALPWVVYILPGLISHYEGSFISCYQTYVTLPQHQCFERLGLGMRLVCGV